MKRLLAVASLVLAALSGTASAATWHSQQPLTAGAYSLLGEVGDIECWNGEANRCLLITAGNAGVNPGLFAYDGSGWYRYATVCGGHEGRIAWAGPTEFWTVSDQQPAGQIPNVPAQDYYNVSLCHFKDGQLVASYGESTGSPNAYLHMAAAACAGPSDCWFGGERLDATSSVNPGAFHLRWNGSALVAIPAATELAELADPGRAVSGLAHHDGSFYEGVDVTDQDVPSETEKLAPQPSFVHRIGALTDPEPFQPLFGESAFFLGGEASELDGFHLTGADSEDLWAIAGSSGEATPLVLRLTEAGLVRLGLSDPEALLEPETQIRGVAAEPGEDAAWVTLKRAFGEQVGPLANPARLTRIDGEGNVGPQVSLPLAGEQFGGEAVGRKGIANAIACPAPEQCWLATSRGWLFHLGEDPAPQSDPAMHVLITSRPPDNSLPSIPPLELPEDDSGSELEPSDQEELPPAFEPLPKRKPALVSKIKQKMLGATVLELTFTLSAKAKVWLIAKKAGHVVAKTPRQTLAKGRRSVRLRLDPDRWPTKLDLKAKKLKKAKGSK